MTQEKKHRPKHPAIRRTLQAMGAIAVCLVLAYLLLMSGMLEQHVLPFLSEKMLGARVTLRIDGWNPLHVGDIAVQEGAMPPFLRIDGVTVQFQRTPDSFLPAIASLDIRQPRIHLDGSDPDNPNYAFLLPYLNGDSDSESDITRWLPGTVAIHEISLEINMPDWSATLSNVGLTAEIEALDRITAVLQGDAVHAGWQSGRDWLDIPLPEGVVDAEMSISPELFMAQANIHLPDFLVLDGSATVALSQQKHLKVAVTEMQLDAPFFGELASHYAPLNVSYDTVVIAPLLLEGNITDGKPVILDAQCDARVEGLVLGDSDAPWYSGALAIKAQGDHDTDSQAVWTATLNQNQDISGTITMDAETITVAATFEDWESASITALWPKPYEAWKTWLPPLNAIKGTAECRIQSEAITFETTLSSLLPSGTAATITSTGNYLLADGHYDIEGNIALGDGACTFTGTNRDAFTATAQMDSMATADVFALLPWDGLKDLRAVINGGAKITLQEDGKYAFDVDATAKAPAYGKWVAPEEFGALKISGKGNIPEDFSVITGNGVLGFADGATVTVDSFQYDLGKSRIVAGFNGEAALADFAAPFGYDDLWGDASFSGKLTVNNWQQGTISPLHITSESLGYGDYSIPYGETLAVESPIRFDIATLTMDAGPLLITLGEGTKLKTDAVTLTANSITATTPVVFETDLSPLVAKQYLADAEGRMEISVDAFSFTDEGLSGNMTYTFDVSRLVLPDKLADIQGMTVTGAATLHPQVGGQGRVDIKELLAAGTTLRKTGGNILLEDSGILLNDVNFELFGGAVTARATLRPFEAGLPLVFSGEVNNLDLSLFTTEFEPPSLVLTGRVNGTFEVGVTAKQLSLLNVDLEAQEEFSMNRDMVEQLLMRQYVGEMAGGRQMERMLSSVIGKNEQRKFDTARLKLGIEEERITGYAKMESDALDLTVDIKADPPALLEALRARQQ